MRTLRPIMLHLLAPCAPCCSRRVWIYVVELVVGALLTPGKRRLSWRTVARLIRPSCSRPSPNRSRCSAVGRRRGQASAALRRRHPSSLRPPESHRLPPLRTSASAAASASAVPDPQMLTSTPGASGATPSPLSSPSALPPALPIRRELPLRHLSHIRPSFTQRHSVHDPLAPSVTFSHEGTVVCPVAC